MVIIGNGTCSEDSILINGECVPILTCNKPLHQDLIHASNCYSLLSSLKDWQNYHESYDDPKFIGMLNHTLSECLRDEKKTTKEIPIHFKKLDGVAKHAKISKHKGVRPSDHRGDFIKIRNGHGTLTMFHPP